MTLELVPTFILLHVSFDNPGKRFLLAGELARFAGVSSDTLRYYERKGVLLRPPRSVKGYRLYPVESLQRVLLVRRAISVGFNLKELAEILGDRARGEFPCSKVRQLASIKLAEIEDRLRDMKILHAELQAIIGDWDMRLAINRDGEPAELLSIIADSERENGTGIETRRRNIQRKKAVK